MEVYLGLNNESMIIDRSLLEEFPYEGRFYKLEVSDSPNLEDRKEVETTIWEGKCDIQESSRTYVQGFSGATFAIYFPLKKILSAENGRSEFEKVHIKRGDSFVGSIYGLEVKGEVVGVFPSQLGGCMAYIKEFGS